MVPYSYKSLQQDGRSIRLLRLMPSSCIIAKVACEIFHAEIDATTTEEMSYEALSYTWGDVSQTVDIDISGSIFPATVSLEAALRCLRKTNEPRVLWVDAVCINQADLQERAAQVRMMWEIYQAASRVVVWLGPEVGDSAIAMENISKNDCQRKMEARKTMQERPEGERDPRWCGCHAGDFENHPSRIGIQSILNSRWFTRVWVLQEVAAAKEVSVACGDKTAAGQDFYNELTSLSSSIMSIQKTLRRCRPALDLMNKQETASRRMAAGSVPLLELIENFRGWDATEDADKLFALLAFSSDASQAPELQPNYTLPIHVLAHRIVQFAYPSCVIDSQASMRTEVEFEIEGMLLGEITCTFKDGNRNYYFKSRDSKIHGAIWNSKARQLFATENLGWEIRTSGERKLSLSSSVVLLRGASRPSILGCREGKVFVEMLAAPEPTQQGTSRWDRVAAWPAAVESLSGEKEGWMRFKLAWDPFSPPDPSKISRYIPNPNDFTIQWEARIESTRDEVVNGGENTHNCKTMSALRMMYTQDKDAIKAGTSKFTMTLHKAAFNGYLGTVKLLLDANANVNLTLDDVGTPLHLAAYRGHSKVVKTLLDANALVDSLDGAGHTPLDLALSEGHTEASQFLLGAGATPSMNGDTTRSSMELLFDFAISGRADKVKELLESGINPSHATEIAGFEGVTGLHLAAEMGRADTVVVFLGGGARVDARTSTATTPLHQASMNGHTEVVKALIGAGANVNAKDDRGTTPLDFALYRRKLDTAQVISAAGGQTCNFGDTSTTADDRTMDAGDASEGLILRTYRKGCACVVL